MDWKNNEATYRGFRIGVYEDELAKEPKNKDSSDHKFWAEGEVYFFLIERGEEDYGAQWGFYGPDHKESGLESQAKNIIDSLVESV